MKNVNLGSLNLFTSARIFSVPALEGLESATRDIFVYLLLSTYEARFTDNNPYSFIFVILS